MQACNLVVDVTTAEDRANAQLKPKRHLEKPGEPRRAQERPKEAQKSLQESQRDTANNHRYNCLHETSETIQDSQKKSDTRSVLYFAIQFASTIIVKCQRTNYTDPPGEFRIPTRTVREHRVQSGKIREHIE